MITCILKTKNTKYNNNMNTLLERAQVKQSAEQCRTIRRETEKNGR